MNGSSQITGSLGGTHPPRLPASPRAHVIAAPLRAHRTSASTPAFAKTTLGVVGTEPFQRGHSSGMGRRPQPTRFLCRWGSRSTSQLVGIAALWVRHPAASTCLIRRPGGSPCSSSPRGRPPRPPLQAPPTSVQWSATRAVNRSLDTASSAPGLPPPRPAPQRPPPAAEAVRSARGVPHATQTPGRHDAVRGRVAGQCHTRPLTMVSPGRIDSPPQ